MPREVEIENVLAKYEGNEALLCDVDGDECWVPFSQISEYSEVQVAGDMGSLIIPTWLARREGWV